MATANLKNLFGGGGGSFVLKAGQSYSITGTRFGGVLTAPLNVSSPTNVISLTGRWSVPLISLSVASPGSGTMTATLVIDGVTVLATVPIGTSSNIPLWEFSQTGMPLVCNSSLVLTLQRTTTDTVTTAYTALAIE